MSDIFSLIKETVPIHDLLDRAGVKYVSRTKNCKVSCPFHGEDNRKSGFVYIDTNTLRCFTCGDQWDQISFWAQANEWWKPGKDGGEVLDIGKAVASLKEEYGIEYNPPSWEQLYRELKDTAAPSKGYDDYKILERHKLAKYYAWRMSQKYSHFEREVREQQWNLVRDSWDTLSDLDLARDGWKNELNKWQENADTILGKK